MSETNEANFGGWSKRRGQDVYEPKDGHPYVVMLTGEGYSATLTGDEPETLRMVPIDGCSKKQAAQAAQAWCEEHWERRLPKAAKLSVASSQLDWSYDEETRVYTAPAADWRTYICGSDNTSYGLRWFAEIDDEELGPDAAKGHETPEAAQAVCQWHADTELRWREVHGVTWLGTSNALAGDNRYCCALSNYAEGWMPQTVGGPEAGGIGSVQSLEQAKEVCQDHHREAHPYEAPEPEPVAEQPKLPLGKPERELVTRSILCQLTPEEQAEAGRLYAEAEAKAEALEIQVADETDRYKAEKKRLEGLVEAAKDEARQLRGPARFGEEYRERQLHEQLGPEKGDGSQRDVIYTDPGTGEEVDRRQASKSELQKWLRGVPEQAQTEQDAALDRVFDMVDLDGKPPADKPPEPEPPPVEAEEATDDEPAPDEAEQAEQRPIKPLKWGKVPGSLIWHTKGCRVHQIRIDLAQRPGQVVITSGAPNKPSEHVEITSWPLPPEANVTAEVKAAKAWCQSYHDRPRIEWPEGGEGCLRISADGRYQLSLVDDPADDNEAAEWLCERIGQLDEDNTDLGEVRGLTGAQTRCQQDADALWLEADEQRRAGQ